MFRKITEFLYLVRSSILFLQRVELRREELEIELVSWWARSFLGSWSSATRLKGVAVIGIHIESTWLMRAWSTTSGLNPEVSNAFLASELLAFPRGSARGFSSEVSKVVDVETRVLFIQGRGTFLALSNDTVNVVVDVHGLARVNDALSAVLNHLENIVLGRTLVLSRSLTALLNNQLVQS